MHMAFSQSVPSTSIVKSKSSIACVVRTIFQVPFFWLGFASSFIRLSKALGNGSKIVLSVTGCCKLSIGDIWLVRFGECQNLLHEVVAACFDEIPLSRERLSAVRAMIKAHAKLLLAVRRALPRELRFCDPEDYASGKESWKKSLILTLPALGSSLTFSLAYEMAEPARCFFEERKRNFDRDV